MGEVALVRFCLQNYTNIVEGREWINYPSQQVLTAEPQEPVSLPRREEYV